MTMTRTTAEVRAWWFVVRRAWMAPALVALSLLPFEVRAQLVGGGDFDICDYCGNLSANTMQLVGRAGFGTNIGVFILINANSIEQDVDRDGYTPGVDFTDLFFSSITDFRDVADPSGVIESHNMVVTDFLNPLRNGFQNGVGISVNIPNGTPAGVYRGFFTVADSIKSPGVNPNGELLRIDFVNVEIEVLPTSGIGLVEADRAVELDSLVIRGRPGQTRTGVVRVANTGNAPLRNVRIEATDLVAVSGTGLRIRSERITFSPATLVGIAIGDTARVVVTVRIPLGILAGAYTGELIVQADDVAPVRVPFTVIVTTPGDIVFEDNPIVGGEGNNAIIIFNADPGTRWQIRVFDMMAMTTFAASGTVFSGTPPQGELPGFQGDQAVRYVWPLTNGRGEAVAGGMYLVVVDAVQDGDRRQLRSKLMVIR